MNFRLKSTYVTIGPMSPAHASAFFGHAKGIAEFTYKKDDLNFKFRAPSTGGQKGEILERDDRTLGPICSISLKRSRQRLVDGKKVTDLRKDLFEGRSLQAIMNEIADFLLIYRDPRFPSPIAIERVTFPFENR